MQKIRKTIKYILWLVLFIFVGLITAGIIASGFDIPAYVNYLNNRDISDISFRNPSSFIQILVPYDMSEPVVLEDLLQEDEDDTDTGAMALDQDFMDFFGDFSSQNRSDVVMTGEDFGFVSEMQNDSGSLIDPSTLTPEEQQLLLLERLKQRELRLEQEAGAQ